MKKVALFIGPSGVGIQFPPAFSVYPPAAMGSVFRAVEEGYSTIAIVDGYFGNVPSVWHKEIIYAMSEGVGVVGSSSMGALRAAELHQHGMLGVGVVFKLFARFFKLRRGRNLHRIAHRPRPARARGRRAGAR